jgi:hypothetical protein
MMSTDMDQAGDAHEVLAESVIDTMKDAMLDAYQQGVSRMSASTDNQLDSEATKGSVKFMLVQAAWKASVQLSDEEGARQSFDIVATPDDEPIVQLQRTTGSKYRVNGPRQVRGRPQEDAGGIQEDQ